MTLSLSGLATSCKQLAAVYSVRVGALTLLVLRSVAVSEECSEHWQAFFTELVDSWCNTADLDMCLVCIREGGAYWVDTRRPLSVSEMVVSYWVDTRRSLYQRRWCPTGWTQGALCIREGGVLGGYKAPFVCIREGGVLLGGYKALFA